MDASHSDASQASALEARLFSSATPCSVSTQTIVETMLDSGKGISDLVFSPGRPPQVERHGELTPVEIPGLATLEAAQTATIVRDLMGGNLQTLRTLDEEGASDFSYAIPRARFRSWRQRSST